MSQTHQVGHQSITIARETMEHLRRASEGFPDRADIMAPVEAAYEALEREYLHQRLAHASALIEYGLDKGLIRLRDRDGRLLLHLGQWLAAVEAGRWPGVEIQQGSGGAGGQVR